MATPKERRRGGGRNQRKGIVDAGDRRNEEMALRLKRQQHKRQGEFLIKQPSSTSLVST